VFKSRRKPRVFLGVVGVLPQDHITAFFEGSRWRSEKTLDENLYSSLLQIFKLPLAAEIENPDATDLSLDVAIQSYRRGELIDVYLNDGGVPVFWRPAIRLRARLTNLSSGKVLETYSVSEKATWREFLSRAVSLRAYFRLGNFFEQRDMQRLLERASARLLQEIIQDTY
jgi:hypothetical protein